MIVAEGLPVQTACRVLGVSETGYYARRGRPPSARTIRHIWLTELIRQIHTTSRGTYGARRVQAELTMGCGVAVGHNAVEMLILRAQMTGLPGNRRRKPKTSGPPTASDLVHRQFARTEPDRLWVTDITEHPTREGKVYCAVVLDTFSRRVAGWSIDSSPTTTLVTSALGMAINNRNPTDTTVIHSDQAPNIRRGCSRAGHKNPGSSPSRGSIGDCFDIAMVESFWVRMQVELLDRTVEDSCRTRLRGLRVP